MKIKLILLILAVITSLSCLFSCGGGDETPGGETPGETPGGDETPGGTDDSDDVVFGGDVAPILIIERGSNQSVVNSIYGSIRKAYGMAPEYYYSDDEELPQDGAHQIVIGNVDRAVTKRALKRLRLLIRDEGEYDTSYMIYAKGNSVSIVYNDDPALIGANAAAAAFDALLADCDGALKLTSGEVSKGIVSTIDFYDETDKAYYEFAWARLKTEIGDEELADEIVAAFQEMYSIYNHDVVTWLANLYDPGVGGFYYSNSARDNGSYAPDTESTGQALGFVGSLGRVRAWRTGHSSGYANTLSETRKDEIRVYIKSLQDPNGFFYNYQWEKSSTDAKASRRARDLGNCTSILSTLGSAPTYDTPTGGKGDGKVVVGTYDPIILMNAPLRVGTSTAVAVSKAVLTAAVPAQFENADALRKYLKQFEENGTNFYPIGNTMTSQMGQVKNRDKYLREQFYNDPANAGKEYESLCSIIIDWFNAHQDPNTGLWDHDREAPANYNGVNGLLKISGVYNAAEAEIPYAEKAAKAAIDAITSDEVMGAVVDLYNTWFSVSNILSNLKNYGKTIEVDGVMMTGKERANKIQKELREIAAPAIIKSGVKISDFEKDDGSYSYTKRASSATSQGMPVAVPGTNEGDVNATVIATNGLVGNIYSALGLTMVSIYTERDLAIFLHIFENLDPVIKHTPIKIMDDEPVNFDDAEVGDDICDLNVNMSGGQVLIEKDTREGATGNTVNIKGTSGAGGYIYSRNNSGNRNGNCTIFETDMLVHSDGTTKTYAFQITIGSSYMFDIVVQNDSVLIREATTTSYGTSRYTDAGTVPIDEWFNVRVEFYRYGYNDEQRAKIYINGELKIVTNGFYGMNKSGKGTPNLGAASSTAIYKMMAANINIQLDNVYTTTTNAEYEVPVDPEGKLVYNIDKDVVVEEKPEA